MSAHSHGRISPARERRKRLAIVLSIGTAATLSIAKLVVALFTGSVAVFSEAVNSLTDIAASAVSLVALRRAASPPDSRHRYGHEKLENVSAIIQGMIILGAIAFVIAESIERLVYPAEEGVVSPLLAASVMLGSAIINLAVATHMRKVARDTDSAAVEADAQHLMTDVYTGAGTAVGLGLLGVTGFERIDSIIALIVSGFIVRTAFHLIVGSTRVLLDEGLPNEEIDLIERLIDSEGVEGLTGFHRLRTRRAGSRRYVDLHLTLEPNLPLWKAHEIAHMVEEAIEERLENVDVLIHIEPDTVAPPPGEDLGIGDTL